MKQLLQITTIPIKYQLKVQDASLQYEHGTAEIEISRERGGLTLRSKPIKVQLDTYEARNSVSPTPKTQVSKNSQNGQKAAYEATAEFAQEGQILLRAKLGEGREAIDQILQQRTIKEPPQFGLGFLPKAGPDISWEGPQLSIEYEMDKLNFDAKVSNGNVQFIPGDIELSIEQYPGVEVKYIGEPIYVPPSAAEHFGKGQQIDVQA